MGSQSPLIVVTGTGTDVGKTHVASALLRAWGARCDAVGYKPIETGVDASGVGADARQLADASTFHVKRSLFGYAFSPPISPHLAARRAGVVLDLARIGAQLAELRAAAGGVIVELAGGLFTPLSRGTVNLDLARLLEPTAILLVASDRIGVLHDVGATLRAAKASGLVVHGVALSAPAVPDASSATNAAEIDDITGVAVLTTFPRAAASARISLAAAATALDRMSLGDT